MDRCNADCLILDDNYPQDSVGRKVSQEEELKEL